MDRTTQTEKVLDQLISALKNFTDYYDQAGMPDRLTTRQEVDPPVGFDGDEVFNVRLGRRALAAANKLKGGP